jgi:cell wall-associated NlpC family hydrolase
MQKGKITILGLILLMTTLSSCTTMTKFTQSVKAKTEQIKANTTWLVAKPKRNLPAVVAVPETNNNANETIEFLDNISVKPGRVYLKKASDALEAEPVLVKTERANRMPDNLTDVEKSNWLQLKYSIQMDIAVEDINNIPLLQKIDEWWGTPYVLGGSSKRGVDCSYFTLDVMNAMYNTNLKRTAAEQYTQSEKIDWSDLKEGDLVFFKTDGSRSISHVGIYMTNNKFVHASTSQGVTISDLSEPYWQKRLYSLGRVLKN